MHMSRRKRGEEVNLIELCSPTYCFCGRGLQEGLGPSLSLSLSLQVDHLDRETRIKAGPYTLQLACVSRLENQQRQQPRYGIIGHVVKQTFYKNAIRKLCSPWKPLIMDDNRLGLAVGAGTPRGAFWQCRCSATWPGSQSVCLSGSIALLSSRRCGKRCEHEPPALS